MNFCEARFKISNGGMARRAIWPKGHFIFLQVPSTISKEIVPKMQSLPIEVKKEFQTRFNNPNLQIDSIYYRDQIAYVGDSNVITSYSVSNEDLFSFDWEEYITE